MRSERIAPLLAAASIAFAGCSRTTTPAEPSLATLVSRIDGREWDGLAGTGQFAVPIRGSSACRSSGAEIRCSLTDTVGEGEGAVTVALVITFQEKDGRLTGTFEDLGPNGVTLASAPVTGRRTGDTLSFLSTEPVTEAGMTGPAFLDFELDAAAPRFAFGVEKADGTRAAIIAGTYR